VFGGDSSYCCGIKPAGEQREAAQQQTVPEQFRQFLWTSNKRECCGNWIFNYLVFLFFSYSIVVWIKLYYD